jgi:antitoxin YefM
MSVQVKRMASEVTYTDARARLAALCDEVAESRTPVIIHRRGSEDVALVSAVELRSLTETAHLLRSPRNARRLLTALRRARSSRNLAPQSVAGLRRAAGLEPTKR